MPVLTRRLFGGIDPSGYFLIVVVPINIRNNFHYGGSRSVLFTI